MTVDATLIAAAAAGIIIGWLVYFFITKFPAHDLQTLLGVVGLIFAGQAVTFIANMTAPNKDAFAVYIIGVLVGMVLYYISKALGVGPTINNPS